MSLTAWIDPRIDQVRVKQVRRYLLARGWEIQPYPGPEILVFQGPLDEDGQPIALVLPSAEHLSDYRMRLAELIAALGDLDKRPAVAVLDEILANAPEDRPLRPRPLDPRIEQLQVEQVREYVLRRGWQIRPDPRFQVLIFQGPRSLEGEGVVRLLPVSPLSSDYRSRLEDLIESLSQFEERRSAEIVDELLSIPLCEESIASR